MRHKANLLIRRAIGIVFFMTPTFFTAKVLLYAALVSRGGKMAYGGEFLMQTRGLIPL